MPSSSSSSQIIPKPKLGSRTTSSSNRRVAWNGPSGAEAVDANNTSTSSSSTIISRPNSVLVGPSSQLRAPTSLLSGALPPGLLYDGRGHPDDSFTTGASITNMAEQGGVPARPRRLWTIKDTALRHIPKFYPSLNLNTTTYVGDASPSVVAVRISECFRKRSIAVEYDDESVTATAMTVDRCHFQVQLWKGLMTPEVDFSHGVVVECLRIRGPTESFHPACRAILQAAMGQSTGDDLRPVYARNGFDFARLSDHPPPPTNTTTTTNTTWVRATPSNPDTSAAYALEQAQELVKKDRLDTQVLGMERIVHLTTPSISGREISLQTSFQLLNADPKWLIDTMVLGTDDAEAATTTRAALNNNNSSSNTSFQNISAFASALLDSNITHSTIESAIVAPEDEGRHWSQLRACALRVLCNAVSNLAEAKVLTKVLRPTTTKGAPPHPLMDTPLLNGLVADLKGANRPPSVVIQAGTHRLASVHEAALCVRILRLLAEHSTRVQAFLQTDVVLEQLEWARTCGRATHVQLQIEAERTYAKLTEHVRSC